MKKLNLLMVSALLIIAAPLAARQLSSAEQSALSEWFKKFTTQAAINTEITKLYTSANSDKALIKQIFVKKYPKYKGDVSKLAAADFDKWVSSNIKNIWNKKPGIKLSEDLNTYKGASPAPAPAGGGGGGGPLPAPVWDNIIDATTAQNTLNVIKNGMDNVDQAAADGYLAAFQNTRAIIKNDAVAKDLGVQVAAALMGKASNPNKASYQDIITYLNAPAGGGASEVFVGAGTIPAQTPAPGDDAAALKDKWDARNINDYNPAGKSKDQIKQATNTLIQLYKAMNAIDPAGLELEMKGITMLFDAIIDELDQADENIAKAAWDNI